MSEAPVTVVLDQTRRESARTHPRRAELVACVRSTRRPNPVSDDDANQSPQILPDLQDDRSTAMTT